MSNCLEYLHPMQCTSCNSVIEICEAETNKIIVNLQGLPVDSIVIDYDVYGICPNCGRKYDMDKNGMYFQLKNKTLNLCPHLAIPLNKEITFGEKIY